MAKSMRSKREKRLRAIRREIVSADPITQKKEDAKLAAQEAALAAPKVPVRSPSTTNRTAAMAIESAPTTSNDKDNNMGICLFPSLVAFRCFPFLLKRFMCCGFVDYWKFLIFLCYGVLSGY